MLSFKDQLEQDMTNVFLNGDEFADQHDIDGVTVLAVLTDAADKTANAEGLTVTGKELHAKAAGLPALYIGRTLMIDGQPYTVTSEPDVFGGGLSVMLELKNQ
jgi:hypothetical protein